MDAWPSLPYRAWQDTFETLRLWLQHVTLYLAARGLTRSFALAPQPVSAFYGKVFSLLGELGLPVKINRKPNELAEAIPFDEDDVHCSYDAQYAQRFWRALVQADRVFKVFRGRFTGKCSPVHFFWGSGDLAVSRFSGRRAPQHPGGAPNMPDRLIREAYSHECSSCGFWPGGEGEPYPFFFSYAYPAPAGFAEVAVKPAAARYNRNLAEFVLPYDAVRESADPDSSLLDFLQSTYEAAADLGGWDRAALETQ